MFQTYQQGYLKPQAVPPPPLNPSPFNRMIVYNVAGGQKITDDGQKVTDDGQKVTEPQKVTEAPVGDCECGLEHKKSPPADSNRIVGGMNVTNENAHPWTVSLNYNLSRLAGYMIGYKGFYDEKRIFHVLEERLENLKIPLPSNVACGGTIISANYIITAAHCVIIRFAHHPSIILPEFLFHLVPEEIQVTIGVHDQNIAISNKDYIHSVKGIKVHEKYTGLYAVGPVEDRTNFDYAILTLSSSLTFTDKISPICLPDYNKNVC